MKISRLLPLAVLVAALMPSSLFANDQYDDEADRVAVSTSRTPIPLRQVGASVSIVTAEDLEAHGVQYVDEALRRLPGVTVSANGGRGGASVVRLRGEEGFRTILLIDGIRIADAAGPQVLVNFASIDVTSIARIEVLRGPQALFYGADGVGGVINIITRRGEGREFAAFAEAGTYDTYTARGFAGGSEGAFDAALGVSYIRTDGFSAIEGDPSLADDDGYRNTSVHGVFGAALGPDTRLELVGRYVDTIAQFDGFAFDPDRQLYIEETAGRAALTTSAFGDINQTLAYNIVRMRRSDFDGGTPTLSFVGAPDSRFDSDRHTLEYIANVPLSDVHAVTFGGEIVREHVTTDDIDSSHDAYAAFAEWQAEWTDTFFTTVGGRYDSTDNFGEHVSGRATAAFLPEIFAGEATKFRASIGTGFRAPSAYEQWTNRTALLPELEEETAIGFDIGVEQSFLGGRGHFAVIYFNQQIEDEVRYDNVFFTGYFQSSGSSHSEGIEVEARLQVTPAISISSQYTYTDATVNAPDPEDGLPRVRRPRHTTSTDIDYAALGGRLGLNINIRSAADNEDGFREFRNDLDDYVVLGAAASFELVPGIEVTVRGRNLTDDDYQEVTNYQTAGRTGYLGLRVRY